MKEQPKIILNLFKDTHEKLRLEKWDNLIFRFLSISVRGLFLWGFPRSAKGFNGPETWSLELIKYKLSK